MIVWLVPPLGCRTIRDVREKLRPHIFFQAGSMFRIAFITSLCERGTAYCSHCLYIGFSKPKIKINSETKHLRHAKLIK
jgi:hypothetical protein